jgi:hypothetical protein
VTFCRQFFVLHLLTLLMFIALPYLPIYPLQSNSSSNPFHHLYGNAETQAQQQTLYDLYISTNGTGWATSCQSGRRDMQRHGVPLTTICYGSSYPFTSFYGIICNTYDGNIMQFTLSSCNLQGTLPPSLGVLTSVNSLGLHANKLNGSLPPEWRSGFSLLQTMQLNSNALTETLPAQWGNISTLQRVDLFNNQLTGTLPPQWKTLSALQRLRLLINNLYGTVPMEWPEGMRSLITGYFCNASCTGSVGTDAECTGSGNLACIGLMFLVQLYRYFYPSSNQ